MNRYDMWLSVVMGVNCSNGRAICQSGLTPKEIYDARENLKVFEIFTERQAERAKDISLEDTDDILKKHLAKGIESVNFSDENFPERLKEIYNAPVVLFYKGDLSLLSEKYTVGIVGSRHCNGEGEKACRLISGDVAKMGGVVISGLAQGIDSISHKSCMAEGGRTVAFTGVPLDEYFPKVNEKFQKQMESEQLVVSEYHSGFTYYSANFIYRNRLIAAASDGLCVIQAKKKSGSLATVNRAIEYDKPVFTVPGSIFSPVYEGSNLLLTEGKATAVTNGVQIMKRLGAADIRESTGKRKLPQISDFAKNVLEALDGAMFPGQLAKAASMPVGVVKAAITELEITGYIQKTETGEYIRCE